MATIGIITPIKNEADNLPQLFDSVISQSLQPHSWVVVDDGSDDGSSALIQDFTEEHEWAYKVENEGEDEYKMQINYAEVLKRGFDFLYSEFGDRIDYYMILDGDMRITETYLERVSEHLESNPEVVIASGGIYVRKNDELVFESRSPMHPAGGATLYDGEFYRSIGGPPLVPGADSATEVKARIRGYEARYLTDIDLKAIQSRPTGAKGNRWKNAKMRGSNNYRLGHRMDTMVAKSIWKTLQPPFYPGIATLWGYLHDWIRREDRIDDAELLDYYRNEKQKEMVVNLLENLKERK